MPTGTSGAGTTGTAERTNSIQKLLTSRVQMEVAQKMVWGQFPVVPPEGDLGGANQKGQTIQIRFQPRLPLATAKINEKTDVTAQTVTDQKVAVTINEYGATTKETEFANIVQKGSLNQDLVDVMSGNMAGSLDRLAGRAYYEGSPVVFRANDVALRVNLDAAADVLSKDTVGMSFLGRGTALLRGAYCPGFDVNSQGNDNYATVVHSLVAQDFKFTDGYLTALQGREGRDDLFNGEIGNIAGLRIMESQQGKIYQGAGTATQAATTLAAAAAAGATTITVTSATGLTVGDFITIGAVEAETVATESDKIETVQITKVTSAVLTIIGMGYGAGGVSVPGLRYDHANATVVVEAAMVAAIPLFGPKSVMKAYGVNTGPMGEMRVTGPFDSLGRHVNVGWYAVVGWAKTVGVWTVRLEVATRQKTLILNE